MTAQIESSQIDLKVRDLKVEKSLETAVAKMEEEALHAIYTDYTDEFQRHPGGADIIRMPHGTVLLYLADKYSKINFDNPREAIMALVFPRIVKVLDHRYSIPTGLIRESVRKTLDNAIDWVRNTYSTDEEIK